MFSPEGRQSAREGFVQVYLRTISDVAKFSKMRFVLFCFVLWNYRHEGCGGVKCTCVCVTYVTV